MKEDARTIGESAQVSPRRMSKDLRRNREQRQKIFDAIAKVLAKEGSATITMDSVASKMGSSKGTIYYYFKSKADMLYQMQMYAYDLFEEAVYPIIDDKTIPPRERLEETIRAHMLVICENWQLWRAMWKSGLIPPDISRMLVRRRTRYEKKLTDLVEELMEAEGLTCVESKTVTRLITGGINSISRWYKKSGRFSPQEVAEIAVRHSLYGPFEKLSPDKPSE